MSEHPMNGYRKRPWELTVLAVFFALVPVLSWLTRFLSFTFSGEPVSALQTLTSFFGAASNGPFGLAHAFLMGTLWVLFLVVAWGIFRVSRWGFFLCIVAAVANSLFSMVTYGVGDSGSGLQEYVGINPVQVGVLLNLVFFIPVVLLLNQKIMAPFFNPKLKWWEQHPRVKATLTIEATIGTETKSYRSFDISASGMFLGTTEFPDLPVGGHFPAVIRLADTGTDVNVLCEAVWISDGRGKVPMGVGVTFQYRQLGQRRQLSQYIKARIREGHLIERT